MPLETWELCMIGWTILRTPCSCRAHLGAWITPATESPGERWELRNFAWTQHDSTQWTGNGNSPGESRVTLDLPPAWGHCGFGTLVLANYLWTTISSAFFTGRSSDDRLQQISWSRKKWRMLWQRYRLVCTLVYKWEDSRTKTSEK